MSYFKLKRPLPMGDALNLYYIHRIATTEAQARAYQVEHYQKTGELLAIGSISSQGYGVTLTLKNGGLFSQCLLTVERKEKQARKVAQMIEEVFPFFVADVLPLNNVQFNQYFLGGK